MFHVCEVCNMFGYVVIGIIAAAVIIFIVWLVISTLPLGPRNPLPLAAPAA